MPDINLTVEHAGETYEVELVASLQWEDDSFDHEFGTEECGHWEIDWDDTTIFCNRLTEDGTEEVDPDEIDGLMKAIVSEGDSTDLSDYEA